MPPSHHAMGVGTVDREISIADEHVGRMLMEYGNPICRDEPFCDLPEWGGWIKYVLRHADDYPEQRDMQRTFMASQTELRLPLRYRCFTCDQPIAIVARLRVDEFGARHICNGGESHG